MRGIVAVIGLAACATGCTEVHRERLAAVPDVSVQAPIETGPGRVDRFAILPAETGATRRFRVVGRGEMPPSPEQIEAELRVLKAMMRAQEAEGRALR